MSTKLLKGPKFNGTLTRLDLRPNGENQEYPYARATLFYTTNEHTMRGDICNRSSEDCQPKAETRTRVHVKAGNTEGEMKDGYFEFGGELSFEDFEGWIKGDLPMEGRCPQGFTGEEKHITVERMELVLL